MKKNESHNNNKMGVLQNTYYFYNEEMCSASDLLEICNTNQFSTCICLTIALVTC